MTIIADGVRYQAETLDISPNSRNIMRQSFALTGPRGATYWLTQGIGGDWHMLAVGRGPRSTWPRVVKIINDSAESK